MITLPDGKICNNLPEQVAKNAKDIFEVAQQWQPYKEQLEADFVYLADILADISAAAVSAIAGQTIAPAVVSATTSISAPSVTGDSIVENMSGYSMIKYTSANMDFNYVYGGAVKNGNKLTAVIAVKITSHTTTPSLIHFANILIPASVLNNLYPTAIGGYGAALDIKMVNFHQYINAPKEIPVLIQKEGSGIGFYLYNSGLTSEVEYYGRVEVTFLLNDNLAA